MNVLFIIRSTAFSKIGGDTVQARSTAKYLRKLGVEVSLKLTHETIDYHPFDLIHFFNLIRPADILHHVKKSGLPFVISPILVDYSEYEKRDSRGLRKILSQFLSSDRMEYLKVLGRALLHNERIQSLEYIWKGHRNTIRQLIRECRYFLPNSEREAQRLQEKYGAVNDYQVVYNGIDDEIFPPYSDQEKWEGLLCVAQFHPSKNQLRLIQAVNEIEVPLTLVGQPTVQGKAYYEKCKAMAKPHIRFIDFLPQDQLREFYKQAEVHVLPSWFETTGLVSLEAAATGCKIVTTDRGDVKEYFGEEALYCDPSSVEDIRQKVQMALRQKFSSKLQDRIFRQFTWRRAAADTYSAYQKAMG